MSEKVAEKEKVADKAKVAVKATEEVVVKAAEKVDVKADKKEVKIDSKKQGKLLLKLKDTVLGFELIKDESELVKYMLDNNIGSETPLKVIRAFIKALKEEHAKKKSSIITYKQLSEEPLIVADFSGKDSLTVYAETVFNICCRIIHDRLKKGESIESMEITASDVLAMYQKYGGSDMKSLYPKYCESPTHSGGYAISKPETPGLTRVTKEKQKADSWARGARCLMFKTGKVSIHSDNGYMQPNPSVKYENPETARLKMLIKKTEELCPRVE